MASSWTQEFELAVALGQVPGHSRVVALGNNPDVDTGAHEDIWPGGGIYPWQTAAVAMEAVSDSANDTSAGTGARTITVDGMDNDYVTVSQTVTLDGVTPVALPTNLRFINAVRVATAGSTTNNVGTVTVRVVAGAVTQATIRPGYGIAQQAIYTVPAGFTLFITSTVFSINRSSGVGRFATFATMFRTSTAVTRMPLELSIGQDIPYRHEGRLPIIVTEKTSFSLRCTSVSTDNTDLTAGFEGILKDNGVN